MRVATGIGVVMETITGIKEIQSMDISSGEAVEEAEAGMTGTIGMIA